MAKRIPLVRDVLDKQVYDRHHLKVGKVDGVILVLRQGRAPCIEAVELHMPTAWRRLWRPLGDWLDRFQRWLGPDIAGPTRIAFEKITRTGIDVDVDVDATRPKAYAWEVWLEHHFVEHLPGGRNDGDKE